MINFLKKNFFISLRNLIGIKAPYFNINNLESNNSISDAFFWRVDNDYNTIFRYTDLPKYFFNEKSKITLFFFDNKNNFFKKINLRNNADNNSDELIIDSVLLSGQVGHGIFYIFHEINKKIDFSVRQSCYTGYSYKKKLYSFVHGNTPVAYNNLFMPKSENKYGLGGYNLFTNKIYKIQNYLGEYDRCELLLMNPCNKKLNIVIGNLKFILNKGESKIIKINDLKKAVQIKSKCYLIRPIVFAYKNNYLDVFHG